MGKNQPFLFPRSTTLRRPRNLFTVSWKDLPDSRSEKPQSGPTVRRHPFPLVLARCLVGSFTANVDGHTAAGLSGSAHGSFRLEPVPGDGFVRAERSVGHSCKGQQGGDDCHRHSHNQREVHARDECPVGGVGEPTGLG